MDSTTLLIIILNPHSAAGRQWRLVRPRALLLGC